VDVGVRTGVYQSFRVGEYVPQVKASAYLSVGSVLVSESLPSSAPYEEPGAEAYGPANEGEPQRQDCYRGEVNCVTGDRMTAQTDLEVGGRGPGLELARTYNSQLAVAQAERGKRGPFGYGWTSSYSAHLAIGAGQAFVRQDDGSTVSFVEGEGGHFTAVSPLVQATLERVGSNYLYTLPDQTVLTFNEEGVLTSETDRNGNTITLIYEKVSCAERGQTDAFVHPDAAGGGGEECPRLAAIEDAAKRKITLKYNEQGLVETATDPMGHKVKYEYLEENLTDVTEPGESTPNWQFKYDSSHQLTSQTEAPGHTTTVEYDGAHRVTAEVDPMGHERTWEYIGSEASPETHIKEPNGAVTVVSANAADLLTTSTVAFGTSIAAKSTYEYNSSDDLVAAIDPNGHETKYGYDAEGNRTSETNADGDETKWTYDSTHDVDTITTPDGETTTIKRDAHGNPEVIERPAPGGSTQKTTYKYDSYGDVESKTNPSEHTWKYEYDSYGDRKAEIDPEGNKRTWEYNEDSQEIATVSPRGNVVGGEPAKFTTKTERDARGRPIATTEPETNSEVKPTNKVKATISGWAQERQTLSAGAGIWEGSPPLSYSYQWEHCNASGGSCSNISGATGSSYLVGAGYVGETLRVVVSAANSAGTASTTSEPTALVGSAVPTFASLFGSNGTGAGQFNHPAYDAIDAHGDVWVSDFENDRLEELSASGVFIEAVGFGVANGEEKLQTCTSSCRTGIAGSGNGQMSGPAGIAIAGGDIFVADYSNDRIDEFNEKGEYVSKFGSKGNGADQLEGPISVLVSAAGKVWVGDQINNRLAEFSSSGTFIEVLGVGVSNGEEKLEACTSSCRAGIAGSGNGEFSTLEGIASSGSNIYVVDHGNDRVEEFNEKNEYVAKFGAKGTGNGEFEGPEGIAVSPTAGSLFVADSGDGRVEEFTEAGGYLAQFGTAGTGNGQLKDPEASPLTRSASCMSQIPAMIASPSGRPPRWCPPTLGNSAAKARVTANFPFRMTMPLTVMAISG
jgi:YD repeat-containing protein